MSEIQRLYIVDDDESVLDSLEFVLQGEGYQTQCFSSAEAFLQWSERHIECLTDTGCLILDCRMPGMGGQTLQTLLSQTRSTLGIVFLTGYGDVPMAVDALKQGAVDFLQKPVNQKHLLRAVKNALIWSAAEKARQTYISRYEQLTGRERNILTLLADGKTNQQIAENLFISARTVEVHRANMQKHLGMGSLAEMVRLYTLVEPYLGEICEPPVRIKRK